MAREYSGMTPRDIREAKECGLHEAVKIAQATRLLDNLDGAQSIDDLRAILSEFITMQTGIK